MTYTKTELDELARQAARRADARATRISWELSVVLSGTATLLVAYRAGGTAQATTVAL